MMSKEGEIRRDDHCLDYAGGGVILFGCHGGKGNQHWEYEHEKKTLRHVSSSKCLALTEAKDKLVMERCDSTEGRQRWKFKSYNETVTS